ncbi:MAG: twin-arginine translocase TatA/TatE family subunit [Bacteroidales bacterium]|nr:twin-arginine translocase TatA/TatE family subunit [Bacteroidales bacterium]
METGVLLFNLGTPEVIGIVVIVLLLFGGKKIPELMKGLGKGVKSFKDGVKDVEKEIDEATKDDNDAKK